MNYNARIILGRSMNRLKPRGSVTFFLLEKENNLKQLRKKTNLKKSSDKLNV